MAEHKCTHEQDFRDIFHKQNAIFTDTQLIKQAILGNGQPGLYQRVNDLEKEAKDTRESRIKIAGIAAGISSAITIIFAVITKFVLGG